MKENRFVREPNVFERLVALLLIAGSVVAMGNALFGWMLFGISGVRGVALATIPMFGFLYYAKARRIGFERRKKG